MPDNDVADVWLIEKSDGRDVLQSVDSKSGTERRRTVLEGGWNLDYQNHFRAGNTLIHVEHGYVAFDVETGKRKWSFTTPILRFHEGVGITQSWLVAGCLIDREQNVDADVCRVSLQTGEVEILGMQNVVTVTAWPNDDIYYLFSRGLVRALGRGGELWRTKLDGDLGSVASASERWLVVNRFDTNVDDAGAWVLNR